MVIKTINNPLVISFKCLIVILGYEKGCQFIKALVSWILPHITFLSTWAQQNQDLKNSAGLPKI